MVKALSLPAQVLMLFAAIAVYGLFGSPTPDNPGVPEILTGLCLVAAAGMGGLRRLNPMLTDQSVFLRTLHVLFFVGLIMPVVTGVLRGNDSMLMARDILAFLFLCLPLFMADVIARHERAERWLPRILVFAGIAFAVRTLMPAFNIWIAQDELLYLSNSPLVLFAAVFMVALLWQFALAPSAANGVKGAGAILSVAVLLAAMLLDVQRATVAAVALSIVILWVDTLVRSPKRLLVPTLLLVAGLAVAYPWLMEAGEAIYRKTSHVGLNMRMQEAGAVLAVLSSDPVALFFGTGWGGVFASPAVGLIEVNYTHSLLSTMFLKGGLVLLTLTGLVTLAALHQVFLIFQRDRGRGLAVFWPLVIPVFLYASHKSLDFGLLLLLIGVWSNQLGRLHKAASSCIQERTPIPL